MSNNLKTFLKGFDLKKSEIEDLLAETPPEGFDAKELAKSKREHLIEVHEAANPRIKEDDINGKLIATEKTLKVKFAKELGIDKSRTDIEKLSTDEFLTLVKSTKDSLSSKSDETLKKEVSELQQKFLNTLDELEKERENKSSEIERVKKEAYSEVENFKFDNTFNSFAEKQEWGVSEAIKKDAIHVAKLKAKEMGWKLHEDGTLTSSDGTGKAMRPDKSGFFASINDYLAVQIDPYLKKSQGSGSEGKPANITVQGVDLTKASATNKETLDWLNKD